MRILIVEDDARLARVLEKGLRENAYAVDVAPTGKQALFLAAVNPYDAILMDVGIPDPNGFDVAHALRERRSTVRILMLTARDAVVDRVRGLDAGADDYLTKPFSFDELLARLRALLRRTESVAPSTLSVGALELDPAGRRASVGGTPLELTAKEYALLEFLARNAGRVVGRAEISDHVWDERYDPASNVIEVYINKLRRKLEERGAAGMIQTRRGAGYVLEPEAAR